MNPPRCTFVPHPEPPSHLPPLMRYLFKIFANLMGKNDYYIFYFLQISYVLGGLNILNLIFIGHAFSMAHW